MKAVFGDTGYWIAVTNPHDSLHARAKAVSRSIAPARIVTSEMVFAEFLNDFSQRGEFLRKLAARFVERARADRNVTIVAQTSRQFRDALSMYTKRIDKTWSLTDCASFLGGRLRLVATIEHTSAGGLRSAGRAVIEKILAHLGLPTEPPSPAPARSADYLPAPSGTFLKR